MSASVGSSGIVFSLLIPAYNEELNLPSVLDDTLATLNHAGKAQPFEILVINDGSSDRTGQVAEEYARRFPCIRVFHHANNIGLGAGLRTGFSHSRGEFVSWIAADGEVKADQAVNLLDIAGDADFITTTRLAVELDGKPQTRPLLRRILTWWMHQFCRVCLGKYPTHFTGIYMVRGSYLRSVPLFARTGLVGMELYFQSLRRGVRICNGQMAICPRLSGKSKVATPAGICKSLIEMVKLRWYLHKGRGTLPATAGSGQSLAA
jgi:glycosyltransferase involved in cell wall biosynthesis